MHLNVPFIPDHINLTINVTRLMLCTWHLTGYPQMMSLVEKDMHFNIKTNIMIFWVYQDANDENLIYLFYWPCSQSSNLFILDAEDDRGTLSSLIDQTEKMTAYITTEEPVHVDNNYTTAAHDTLMKEVMTTPANWCFAGMFFLPIPSVKKRLPCWILAICPVLEMLSYHSPCVQWLRSRHASN